MLKFPINRKQFEYKYAMKINDEEIGDNLIIEFLGAVNRNRKIFIESAKNSKCFMFIIFLIFSHFLIFLKKS